MLHAKCESDGTNSTPPKSPISSPKQALYYVLSPPHDSSNYDDNKSSPLQTSPLSTSPMDSPSHPSRHSHSSSSSRVSSGFARKWNRKMGWNHHECSVIKEEEEYDYVYCDYERCKCLIAVMALAIIFTLFCFIIWGASRPYQPRVSVKSLTVYNFYSGEGSDYSGGPNQDVNSKLFCEDEHIQPRNILWHSFSLHCHKSHLHRNYSCNRSVEKNYLPRKGHQIVDVNMEGQRVPLYGAGASLPMSDNNRKVPLKLDFEIVSRGNVVGKLVKTKHKRHIYCFLVVDSRNTKVIKFEENSCSYD